MEGFQNFNSGNNFDPNSLANMTSTVIMFVVINDVSPSITAYADNMNKITEEVFMKELKNCHRKSDIVVKGIDFCDSVSHKSGFMPILSLPDDYLHVKPQGTSTALYDAVLIGLDNAIEYRKDLENQGIEVRTCIFIVTDGQDICSAKDATVKIKQIVEELRSNEAWINSFTINMLGIGEERHFKDSCVKMGLDPDKCLVTVGNSASEIRKHMGVISQSVSSSSSTTTVSF